jgi:hypothetical protein
MPTRFEKVRDLLIKETGGKSYKAHKYSLDTTERSNFDYETENIQWKKMAETTKHNKYIDLHSTYKKINSKNKEAAKIDGIIAQTSMNEHYDRVANREWWASEFLRYFTFFLLLVYSVQPMWAFHDITQQNLQWESVLIFRISLGLPWIGFAVYCARESSRHRTNEMRNRQIATELATIGPYLNNLPQDKKNQLLEKFAEKYFGGKCEGTNSDDLSSLKWNSTKGLSINKLLTFIERIIKIVH